MRISVKYLVLLALLLAYCQPALAKDLEFSLPYEQSWLPAPKFGFLKSKKSIHIISSQGQFRRIFGVSSPVKINWKENFLILGSAGLRNNGSHGLSIDSVSTVNKNVRNGSGSDSRILVSMTETVPGNQCATLSVMSYPTAIIQVKKGDLENVKSKTLSAKLSSYNKITDQCEGGFAYLH